MSSQPTVPLGPPCRWCNQHHARRHLCDAAAHILDGIWEKGRSYDLPSMELPEPVRGALGLGPIDEVLRQIVIMAATADVNGVTRPALAFTGRNYADRPLPRWLYIGSDEEVRTVLATIAHQGSLALQAAASR